jgi:hypothetical protein
MNESIKKGIYGYEMREKRTQGVLRREGFFVLCKYVTMQLEGLIFYFFIVMILD